MLTILAGEPLASMVIVLSISLDDQLSVLCCRLSSQDQPGWASESETASLSLCTSSSGESWKVSEHDNSGPMTKNSQKTFNELQ